MDWFSRIVDGLPLVGAYSDLRTFLETGGWVLYLILAAAFVMWTLIVERYWFYLFGFPRLRERTLSRWQARTDKRSWSAHRVRQMLVSRAKVSALDHLSTIKVLVLVAPMMGLLGTVSGMVEVFDVMAFTGASNARAMASGVAKATLPTMAGMVVSLSGLFFASQLERRVTRSVDKLADKLTLEEPGSTIKGDQR